jgi:hypothetical protein
MPFITKQPETFSSSFKAVKTKIEVTDPATPGASIVRGLTKVASNFSTFLAFSAVKKGSV